MSNETHDKRLPFCPRYNILCYHYNW